MLSIIQANFLLHFQLCTLIYLSHLIKPVRTSSTKLNRNDKGKYFSFIPKFKGNIHHQERPVATEGLEGCLGKMFLRKSKLIFTEKEHRTKI